MKKILTIILTLTAFSVLAQPLVNDVIIFPREKSMEVEYNGNDTLCLSGEYFINQDVVDYFGGSRQFAAIYVEQVVKSDNEFHLKEYGIKITPTFKFIDIPTNDTIRVHDLFWRFINRDLSEDFGILYTFSSSGGVAALDQLGARYPYGVASLRENENVFYPFYNWNTDVSAHESGHIFGSPHTHACKWNGDNTAIDDFFHPEGNCAYGPRLEKGTIMSYAHLRGKKELKVRPQPRKLVRQKVYNYNGVCKPVKCNNEVEFEIVFDDAREITWKLGSNQGGPYPKDTTQMKFKVCSGPCDTLKVYDSEGDGLVGECITGFIALNDKIYDFVGDSVLIPLCGDTTTRIPCINIAKQTIFTPQSTNNRPSEWGFADNTLKLTGNIWTYIEIDEFATRNSVLRFEFKGDGLGEIQGISITESFNPFTAQMYNFTGTQGIGNRTMRKTPDVWHEIEIPLSSGQKNYIFFIEDNDFGRNLRATTQFRNLCIIEKNSLPEKSDNELYNVLGQRVDSNNIPNGIYFNKKGEKLIIQN